VNLGKFEELASFYFLAKTLFCYEEVVASILLMGRGGLVVWETLRTKSSFLSRKRRATVVLPVPEAAEMISTIGPLMP